MMGQYTTEELKSMGKIISNASQLLDGLIIRKAGHTVNYYRQCPDKSWINYDCKTKY